MMLQQVVTFLCRGKADDPKSPESLESADGVAEVLAAYVKYYDPYYGPKPLVGGILGMAASLMTAAAEKFVVAHEYGHILAGHWAKPNAELVKVESKLGTIEVLRKNYEQEFEADDIGYRLTLGVASTKDFNLGTIDAAHSGNPDAMPAAHRQECLIAGPFVLLRIDAILRKFQAAHLADGNPTSDDTHPPAAERIKALMAHRPGRGRRRYSGFTKIPSMLQSSVERIVGVMTDRVSHEEDAVEEDEDNDEGEDAGNWFDDIMRCVEAIHRGDYVAAALSLTDTFEKQRTIIEPDVDVVRRELVRAALGRPTDIRRTLLDRHRDRRAAEQYFESAARSPFAQFAGPLPGGPRFPVAGLADLGLNEEAKGLGLVQAVMEEEATKRASSGAEAHLLDGVLYAWRGERERSLASLQAVLAAGMADPHDRLAGFVALEKRALELGVELDIQKLLAVMRLNAIRDKKKAARQLAQLVKDYTEYLGIPLGPVAQEMVDASR